MIFITAAMLPEAKPLIEKFQLKRCPGETKYQIFSNDNIVFIVTGVGAINAMNAAVYLLTRFNAKKRDCLINIGICAVMDDVCDFNALSGRVWIARSIQNPVYQRCDYPDLLYKTPFEEADLVTLPMVFRRTGKTDPQLNVPKLNVPLLVDMEAYYIFEAATVFLCPHRIFILKIISDTGEPDRITPLEVYQRICDRIGPVCGFIEDIMESDRQEIVRREEKELPEEIREKIGQVIIILRLTQYQQIELNRLANQSFLRGKHLMDMLNTVPGNGCKTKTEGKEQYGHLRELLMEP